MLQEVAADAFVPDDVEGDIADYPIENNDGLQPSLPRMVTLYLGKGKKDKISKGDVVGFLCKKVGLDKTDIGRIDVKDYYTYVAVNRLKARQVLTKTKGEKIKGIKTVWEIVD